MYRKSGPRLSTMVISLSDPKEYGNGETVFPKLGNKKFKLNKGDALLFHSIDKNEKLIDHSFHGGEPLTYGEKRICNIWVHGTPHQNNNKISLPTHQTIFDLSTGRIHCRNA